MARSHGWTTALGPEVTLGQAYACERLWLKRDSLGAECEANVTAAIRSRFEGK